MDQDSGRGTGRSVPRPENRAGPRHRLDTDRPPSGAANPLPRRSAQGHIEPQLRTPGSAGTGTPFTPFAADGDPVPGAGPRNASDGTGAAPADGTGAGGTAAPAGASRRGPDDAPETSAAADFHAGADRSRRSAEPSTS